MDGTESPRRRRRSKPRKRSRRILIISTVICLPILLAIPAARYFGWLPQQTAAVGSEAPRPFDLVLSEASVQGEGEARQLTGVIRNVSNRRYDGIEVSFVVRDARAMVVETVIATVDHVEPNGTATFRTKGLPPGSARVSLREITGTPR